MIRTDGKTKHKQSPPQNTPVRPICRYPEDNNNIMSMFMNDYGIENQLCSFAVTEMYKTQQRAHGALYIYV